MRMGLDCLLPVGALGVVLTVAGALQAWGQAEPACKAHGDGPCCAPEVARHLPRSAVFAACREDKDTFLGERGSKDTCRYFFRAKAKGEKPSGKTAAADNSSAGSTPAASETEGQAEGHVEIYLPPRTASTAPAPAASPAGDPAPGSAQTTEARQGSRPSPGPSDPFFTWTKVGKAFVTTRATTPRSAPLLAASTGIFLPEGTDGSSVSVNASTKVCTPSEAQKLARAVR